MNITWLRQIMESPDTSDWLKNALMTALKRDPIDAANDAEVLYQLLMDHADYVLEGIAQEMSLAATMDYIERSLDAA